jgi:hypothetical protein
LDSRKSVFFFLLCPGFVNGKYGDLSICAHERSLFFGEGGGGVLYLCLCSSQHHHP